MNIKHLIKRLENIEGKASETIGKVTVKIIDRKEGDKFHVCKELSFTFGDDSVKETETDYLTNL